MQKKQRVTREKAIAYLNQYQDLKVKIQKNIEKSMLLKSRASSAQMNLDSERVQTSPKDKISELMAKACDLDTQVKKDQEKAEQVKADILLKLLELDNTKEADVLASHYIDDLTFSEIASKVNNCERYVYQLHKNGILYLAKIL